MTILAAVALNQISSRARSSLGVFCNFIKDQPSINNMYAKAEKGKGKGTTDDKLPKWQE